MGTPAAPSPTPAAARGRLPVGPAIDWTPARAPAPVTLRGRYVVLRPLDSARDAGHLYAVSHPPYGDPGIWTYLPDGPYADESELARMLRWAEQAEDRVYLAVVPLHVGEAVGQVSYRRAKPETGSIEIGHIWFGLELRRTRAATEALYLLAAHAFDELGYRRLEWKCDALNAASRACAERLGFTYEGTFRHHQVVKGRSRDTAWFAITDADWPALKDGFERWLGPENFTSAGRQRTPLRDCRAAAQPARRRAGRP